MRKQLKKTITALALLSLGGAVLGRSLWNQSLAPAPVPAAASQGERELGDLPPMDDGTRGESAFPSTEGHSGVEQVARMRRDLLSLFGSYQPGDTVCNGFREAGFPPASPLVEMAPRGMDLRDLGWGDRPDPAAMRVTLIMITASAVRAAVDGAVVGVGDRVASGVVTRIVEDGIEVGAGGDSLFYDVEMPYPREFRAEHARREAERRRQGSQRGPEVAVSREDGLK